MGKRAASAHGRVAVPDDASPTSEEPRPLTDGSGTDAHPPASTPLSDAERRAALAAGAPKISRRVVAIVVAAVVVLGLGGTLLERVFSDAGLNPVVGPPASAGTTTAPGPAGRTELGSSLPRFMGLTVLRPRAAPPVDLTDQGGRAFSFAQVRGEVVVVSFFDTRCRDICPVLASELAGADDQLGASAARVVFVTVNTDPLATQVAPSDAALTQTRLSGRPNWRLVGGSLAALNAVWRDYGVSINVSPTTGLVAHNDLLYFIDPSGRLRLRATPFADESAPGTFSLDAATTVRWSQGIATYAASLLPASR